MMVGRWVSFWDCLFLGAMLDFRGILMGLVYWSLNLPPKNPRCKLATSEASGFRIWDLESYHWRSSNMFLFDIKTCQPLPTHPTLCGSPQLLPSLPYDSSPADTQLSPHVWGLGPADFSRSAVVFSGSAGLLASGTASPNILWCASWSARSGNLYRSMRRRVCWEVGSGSRHSNSCCSSMGSRSCSNHSGSSTVRKGISWLLATKISCFAMYRSFRMCFW